MTQAKPAFQVKLKPFTGVLPARKGPSERKPNPFDELIGSYLPTDGAETGQAFSVSVSDADERKLVVRLCRGALEHIDTAKAYGLRTWHHLDDAVVFQVGPRKAPPQAKKVA
jgi:hypothetical protein